MTDKINILCFEDLAEHQQMLREIFADRANIKFFDDWDIDDPARVREITQFKPKFAIVDLLCAKTEDKPGYRVIRKIQETFQLPVVAWSVLFNDSPDGIRAQSRVEGMGVKPVHKVPGIKPSPDRFLEAAGF
ncbi:MAG TPA: hypothetical protein VHA33_05840 [Candidatus Angelobacter sp.]|nr:hypothetical protein [Candidatus Angelobacter sp.]